MKNDLLLLISFIIFTYHLLSCKKEEDNLLNQNSIQKNTISKSIEFQKNNSNNKKINSVIIEYSNELNKGKSDSISNRESNKEKKKRKTLLPGITPLSN